MNKSDLILALAKETDLPLRKAEEIVNLVFDTMSVALHEGDRIEIRGFGSFMVKEYQGYTGRNPKTGDKIDVSEKRLPFFKTGKELREKVDEPLPVKHDKPIKTSDRAYDKNADRILERKIAS